MQIYSGVFDVLIALNDSAECPSHFVFCSVTDSRLVFTGEDNPPEFTLEPCTV